MINHPFPLLRPFSDRLRIVRFDKRDPQPQDVATALDVRDLVSAEQVHGNVTTIVRTPVVHAPGADGLVTDRIGLALTVRTADCQSFIVYAPQQHVLGVLHAGWRGLTSGAIPNFFSVLRKEWGIAPEETFVCAGPSLCQTCAEFTDPQRELPTIDQRFFQGRHVDLRGAADGKLSLLGVPASHRERSPDCTRCQSDTYWSWRGGDQKAVQGGQTNILAAVLLPVLR